MTESHQRHHFEMDRGHKTALPQQEIQPQTCFDQLSTSQDGVASRTTRQSPLKSCNLEDGFQVEVTRTSATY